MKIYTVFMEDLKDNITDFIPTDNLREKTERLFELGRTRANVIILPYRKWNTMRRRAPYSAGIIAEIGDIHRFPNQAALAKYAGLAWTQHQSGNFEAQNTRLIKSGNRFLKYYLGEAALSLVRCDDLC